MTSRFDTPFPPTFDKRGKLLRTPEDVAVEILAMLKKGGPMQRTSMLAPLKLGVDRVREAMGLLECDNAVEAFKMRSPRGRMEVFYCAAGMRPSPATPEKNFRAREILAGFRAILIERGHLAFA